MKFTRTEFERILEALDMLIEERTVEGRASKSFYRLRDKVLTHAEKSGKIRG